jgi:hypothetical protein
VVLEDHALVQERHDGPGPLAAQVAHLPLATEVQAQGTDPCPCDGSYGLLLHGV